MGNDKVALKLRRAIWFIFLWSLTPKSNL